MTLIIDKQAEKSKHWPHWQDSPSMVLPFISQGIKEKERRERIYLRATGSNCSLYDFFFLVHSSIKKITPYLNTEVHSPIKHSIVVHPRLLLSFNCERTGEEIKLWEGIG